MIVHIHLIYILGIIIYSCFATGLALCFFVAATREAEDSARITSILRIEIHEWVKKLSLATHETDALRAANTQLSTAVSKLAADKRILADSYIKTMNEYAWYRILTGKSSEPEAPASAHNDPEPEAPASEYKHREPEAPASAVTPSAPSAPPICAHLRENPTQEATHG
jgi:hypothetical protein